MLRGMRKASSNWLGKTIMAAVMGVLIISFGVWGIADIFRGFGRSTLAKIGHTEISAEQFRQLYTEKLQQIGRQFGRPLTSEQARAFGLDRQLLQQTIAEASLDEAARRMGLTQSDADVVRAIHEDPNFKNAAGNFDPLRFSQLIRQFGYTEPRYITEQRRVLLRREIAGTLSADLKPAAIQVDAMHRFQSEQRSVEFLRLVPALAGTVEPPAPEALASYFDERKSLFRAPEFRKVTFVVATPEALANTASVSDEEVRKAHDEALASLSTPEKRQVFKIGFANIEEAKAARERIAAGLSFEDVAKERNLSPADVDLGLVARSGILDAAVADAAFALNANDVSQPIQGQFGIALVKVTTIEPGKTPSYDEVAPKLRAEMAQARAKGAVSDVYNKIEDERGGGASLADAAQKVGLTPVTIDAVDRSGRGPNGQPVSGLPQGIDLVNAAFASNVNVENDPQQYKGGYIWYDVVDVIASRERGLDEVKDQVEARWKDDQISMRLRDKAKELEAKLEGGASMADTAAGLGIKLESASAFKRAATLENAPETLVTAAFHTPKGGYGTTPGATATEFLVFHVTDVTVPPLDLASADTKKLQDVLQKSLTDEQIGQYIAKLETEVGVSINEAAFAAATGAVAN
ncbi:MAG: SurA N-terminal domain-containing protein [Xanthobacteraceae bacterium]